MYLLAVRTFNVNVPCIPVKYMGFRTWKLIGRHAVLDDKGNDSDEKVRCCLASVPAPSIVGGSGVTVGLESGT